MSPGTKKLLVVIAGIVIGLCALFAAVAGVALIVDVAGSPSTEWDLLTPAEADGVEGLSAMIFTMGQRGDTSQFLELAAGDTHVRPEALKAQFASMFATAAPTDFEVDHDSVQTFVDQSSGERIIAVRMIVTAEDGQRVNSGPLYMVESKGAWRLTGLDGRRVEASD